MNHTTESDPSGRNPHEPGAKLDNGKTLAWLFHSGFARALEHVAEITTVGARKYTPGGWAEVPNGVERYMEAFGRHQFDLAKGIVFDDGPNGTGKRHKGQMIWNLLASLELELRAEEDAARAKEIQATLAGAMHIRGPITDQLARDPLPARARDWLTAQATQEAGMLPKHQAVERLLSTVDTGS